MATTEKVAKSCNRCGKSSSTSLLRCSQCKQVYYCSRSCQSLAWKGKNGHRHACRKSSSAADDASGQQQTVNATVVELIHHVQQMDCQTAYEQMCRAQDEIRRLQQKLQREENENEEKRVVEEERSASSTAAAAAHNNQSSPKVDFLPKSATAIPEPKYDTSMKKAHGLWLDLGGMCSIEYFPNIQCYHVTLLTNTTQQQASSSDLLNFIPTIRKDDLQFTMSPITIQNRKSHSSSGIEFYEMKLAHLSSSPAAENPLITLILPIFKFYHQEDDKKCSPITTNISVDNHSTISLRIHLKQLFEISDSFKSMNLTEYLLGSSIEGSSVFSPATTSIIDINHLCCRTCQSSIILLKNNSNNNTDSDSTSSTSTAAAATTITTIHSVLPLPSGYWDDIEDYLICYDGQANVNFNSSTMNAIRNVALEDDAVIVLHRDDVIDGESRERGGVCTTRDVKGYGEHSSSLLRSYGNSISGIGAGSGGSSSEMITSISSTSSQLWKDKSAMKVHKGNTLTCSNCCSALGFVSGNDSNTFRFYKHLLSCGNPSSSLKKEKNVFSKHTCGSFLAREMVRYADNEAIYTFIVGVSDENDWTRMSRPSECILLHMISWDSVVAGLDGSEKDGEMNGDGVDDAIQFEKVLKVIFDKTTDRGQHSSSVQDDNDDVTKWTWGRIDLCCPPSSSSSMADEASSPNNPQTKASSVRIFISKQEWSGLEQALITGSAYFSESVKDAFVVSKLGMPVNGRHHASLSYLPLLN